MAPDGRCASGSAAGRSTTGSDDEEEDRDRLGRPIGSVVSIPWWSSVLMSPEPSVVVDDLVRRCGTSRGHSFLRLCIIFIQLARSGF